MVADLSLPLVRGIPLSAEGLDIVGVFNKTYEDPEYRLSREEAREVWWEVYQLFKAYPDTQGGMLKQLFGQIEREAWEGKRCGVCGEYESPDCWDRC